MNERQPLAISATIGNVKVEMRSDSRGARYAELWITGSVHQLPCKTLLALDDFLEKTRTAETVYDTSISYGHTRVSIARALLRIDYENGNHCIDIQQGTTPTLGSRSPTLMELRRAISIIASTLRNTETPAPATDLARHPAVNTAPLTPTYTAADLAGISPPAWAQRAALVMPELQTLGAKWIRLRSKVSGLRIGRIDIPDLGITGVARDHGLLSYWKVDDKTNMRAIEGHAPSYETAIIAASVEIVETVSARAAATEQLLEPPKAR